MPFRFAITLVNLMVIGLMGAAAFGDEGSLTLPTQTDEPVTLRLPDENVDWEVTDPSSLLQIFVGQVEGCCDDKTPMAGRYEHEGNVLTFTPAFSFVAGQDYVVRLEAPEGQKGWAQERTAFSIVPDTPPAEAKVVGVYPSGDVLPANVLRFYIHFATPMKPHVAFDYITLRDASGHPDDAAFMRFKQELWSEDRTRLTVLMDPGRIKRNVATNVRLGPALLAGEHYELVVEGGWPTADGTSALTAFSKPFSVSAAPRELPNTDRWDIIAPDLGTEGAIEIRFDRPFDHELLQKDIRVLAKDGLKIGGKIQIGKNEKAWRFLPDKPWSAETILLTVNSVLEDVAGNNFRDLLDHKVGTEAIDISEFAIPITLNP